MITEEILKDIVEMLDIFGPVTLEEMSGIRLMNRTDTKYLLPLETLAVLLYYAAADYRVQEVAGERNIVYHTVYLDTVDKAMYRAHQNGRAVREKIRVRTYVASQLTFLEVKIRIIKVARTSGVYASLLLMNCLLKVWMTSCLCMPGTSCRNCLHSWRIVFSALLLSTGQ